MPAPARLYEEMAYGPDPIANSYWRSTTRAPVCPPLSGAMQCDTAIIGAGYTGLNAALALAKAGQDVVVIEANQPGWGASGRNGGFCCLGGGMLDGPQMIKRFGQDATVAFTQAQMRAVDHVAGVLEAHGIEADTHSEGETLLAHTAAKAGALRVVFDEAKAAYGDGTSFLRREELAEHGLNSSEFHGALTIPVGFALNPMKYATGLARVALDNGARIFGDSPVMALDSAPDGRHLLRCATGTVTARNLILATNGYSSETLPAWLGGRFLPVQSSIMVTRPLSDAELERQGWTSRQMCYDSRHLLHYFRLLPDNRMLFGLRASYRATPAKHAATQRRARRDFDRVFPEWRGVETAYYWSGLLALARRMMPFCGPVPGMTNTWAAMCYHGNGVALGSYAGAMLAAQITGTGPETPALMTHPLKRFELGRWRRLILPLVYGWYELQDRF